MEDVGLELDEQLLHDTSGIASSLGHPQRCCMVLEHRGLQAVASRSGLLDHALAHLTVSRTHVRCCALPSASTPTAPMRAPSTLLLLSVYCLGQPPISWGPPDDAQGRRASYGMEGRVTPPLPPVRGHWLSSSLSSRLLLPRWSWHGIGGLCLTVPALVPGVCGGPPRGCAGGGCVGCCRLPAHCMRLAGRLMGWLGCTMRDFWRDSQWRPILVGFLLV